MRWEILNLYNIYRLQLGRLCFCKRKAVLLILFKEYFRFRVAFIVITPDNAILHILSSEQILDIFFFQ